MSSAGYRAILDYLVNHHSKDEPATANQIVEGSGISKPSVYRLIADKRNGDVGDETVSAGIFIAPITTRVGYSRPSKMYYADPSRIKDKTAENVVLTGIASKIPLPKQPVAYILQGYYKWTGSLETAVNRMRLNVEAATQSKASTRKIYEAIFSINEKDKAILQRAIANYDDVMNNGGVVNSDLHKQMAENIRDLRNYHAQITSLCDRLMQDPAFDTNPMLLLDEAREAVLPIHPVVRKV